jgi:hypothetical protein
VIVPRTPGSAPVLTVLAPRKGLSGVFDAVLASVLG